MPRAKKTEDTAGAKSGTEHARDLEHALEFYRAEYPSEWLEEQNYPLGHLDTIIARLRQK